MGSMSMRCGVTAKASRGTISGKSGLIATARVGLRVNNRDDVADYCAKYVSKEGAWWDVKLQGRWHLVFNDFKLSSE
jgi:hypothetical protein